MKLAVVEITDGEEAQRNFTAQIQQTHAVFFKSLDLGV